MHVLTPNQLYRRGVADTEARYKGLVEACKVARITLNLGTVEAIWQAVAEIERGK